MKHIHSAFNTTRLSILESGTDLANVPCRQTVMYSAICNNDPQYPYCEPMRGNDTYDIVVVQPTGNVYQVTDLSKDFVKVNASTYDLNSNQVIFVAATTNTSELVVYEGKQQVARHTLITYVGKYPEKMKIFSSNSRYFTLLTPLSQYFIRTRIQK